MSTTDPKADDDRDETTTNTTARETDPASGSGARDDLDAKAGHRGILTTARCVECKTVRRKLAPDEIADRDGDHPSFRHICHDCQRVTWYNTIQILEDRSTEGSDQ